MENMVENSQDYTDENKANVIGDEGHIIGKEQNVQIIKAVLDDSAIETDNSPFKTYGDEIQSFPMKNVYIPLGKVMQQYRNGEISDRMLRILEIMLKYKYVSARQIWQIYLIDYGLYIGRANLNRTLRRMSEKALIVVFDIKSPSATRGYRVYCADYNGARLGTAVTKKQYNWTKTDYIEKTYKIKRTLAANQLLIAFLKHFIFDYEISPKLTWADSNGKKCAVVPAIKMVFSPADQTDKEIFLIEVIREYRDWRKDYSEKLIRYGRYLHSIEMTRDHINYHLIVCAESQEQISEAIDEHYQLWAVAHATEVRNVKPFYIHDLDLLDANIENSLLENIKGKEYDAVEGKWVDTHIDFEPEERSEDDFEVEMDSPMEEDPTIDVDIMEEEFSEDDRRELAIKIYEVVCKKGWKFPQPMTRLAIPLRGAGIDYKNLGFRKFKQLFVEIEEFYTIRYDISLGMVVEPTEELSIIAEKMGIFPSNELKEHLTADKIFKVRPVMNNGNDRGNIISQYFTEGIMLNRELKKNLLHDIYFFNKWEISASLLKRMTRIYDLNDDGWLNILAYSYDLAKKENRLIKNEDSTYLCFDTGLRSLQGRIIYFLVKKNYRDSPEWVLEGVSTVDGKVLGEKMKREFGLTDSAEKTVYNGMEG